MVPPKLEKLLHTMVLPLEEADKTSKLVLSLSTGALALLIGFLKGATLPTWARLLIGVSVLILWPLGF